MMKKVCGLTAILAMSALPVMAACPSSPLITIKLQAGEQQVSQSWLEDNLTGRKVVFDDGREDYKKNGTYVYRAGGQSFRADSYRFYADGTRCIGYSNPRFDRYAVKDGALILINAGGGRFEGTVKR